MNFAFGSLRCSVLLLSLTFQAATVKAQAGGAAKQGETVRETDGEVVDLRDWRAAHYAHMDSIESYDLSFKRLSSSYDKSGKPTKMEEMRGRMVRNHSTDENFYVFRYENLLTPADPEVAANSVLSMPSPYRFEYGKWNGQLSEGGSIGRASHSFSIVVTPENHVSAYGQGQFPTLRLMGVGAFPVRDVYASKDTMLSDTVRAKALASPSPAQLVRRQDGQITFFRIDDNSDQNLSSEISSQYDEVTMVFVSSTQTRFRDKKVFNRASQALDWGTCDGVAVPTSAIFRSGIDDEGQPETEQVLQFQWNSVSLQDDAFYEPMRQLPFRSSHLSQLEAFLNRSQPAPSP